MYGIINKITFNKIRIKEIVEYAKTGFAAGKEQQTVANKSSIIQIRPTNIDNEGVFKFDKNIYVENIKNSDYLNLGEVLFNNTNSQELVGKTSIFNNIEGRYCCSNHITRLRVNSELIIGEYLKEVLNFYQRKKIFYNICTNWNNQSGINYSVLGKVQIPLPPKQVQQEIIDIMHNAYTIKQQKEKEANELLGGINDYLLGELGITMPEAEENTLKNRISYVTSVDVIGGRFDPLYHKNCIDYSCEYPFVHFGELIEFIYRYPTFYGIQYLEKGVGVIKGENISRSGEWIKHDKINYIDDETNYMFKHTVLEENDLVMTVRGEVGKVGIVNLSYVGFNINANVIRIKLNKSNNVIFPLFVWNFLNTTVGKKNIKKYVCGGIQETITVPEIKKILIPIPPFDKQKEIAKHIQKIREKAKQLEEEAISELNSAKLQVEKILLRKV